MRKQTDGKKGIASSAYTAFLRLLADSKWSDKRAFYLWPVSESWRNRVIRSLQKDGLIACLNLNARVREQRRKIRMGKVENNEEAQEYKETIPPSIHGLRYYLTKKGREFLRTYNPKRYGSDDNLALSPSEYQERRIYRLSLLSETRAMSEFAGYSVHPDTKPDITALSGFPLEAAGRPACAAHAAKPLDPERFRGVENSIFNQGTFRYYDKNIRRHSSREARDTKEYSYRETPIGCIYLLPELQQLVMAEAEFNGGKPEVADQTRYARTSGVFFSGNGPYLLYNTERTAIRLRPHGEQAIRAYVDSWAWTVYRQSLTLVQSDGDGNQVEEPLVPKIRGAILFGDETHKAALNVVQNTIESESRFGRKWKTKGASENYNLLIVPDTYYLPVIREAIPLYSLMGFPHWPMYLKDLALNYWERLCQAGKAPDISREYIGEKELTATLEDGSTLFVLIGLHLDTVRWMIGDLLVSQNSYTILAMEWQKPFFDGFLEKLEPESRSRLRITYLPQQELEGYVENLYEEQGLPYRI